jgi:hypothetical protein
MNHCFAKVGVIMHIRALIKDLWEKAGAVRNPKVREFLKFMEKETEDCWENCIREFRQKYYDLFDLLVPPLLNSDDKLLRLNLIRRADLTRPQEVKLLSRLAQKAAPQEDELELRELAGLRNPELRRILVRRKDLTYEVRQVLQPSPRSLPRAANIAAPRR